MILENQEQWLAFFRLNLVLSHFVQSLFGSVYTIGEEFGRRGYVQEKLIWMFVLYRGLYANLGTGRWEPDCHIDFQ